MFVLFQPFYFTWFNKVTRHLSNSDQKNRHLGILIWFQYDTFPIRDRELVKYECDPKLQMLSESQTDVAKNDSCPTLFNKNNACYNRNIKLFFKGNHFIVNRSLCFILNNLDFWILFSFRLLILFFVVHYKFIQWLHLWQSFILSPNSINF